MKKTIWWMAFGLLFFLINLYGIACMIENDQQMNTDPVNQVHTFIADGVVSVGEYKNQVTYQSLEIFWSNDEVYIYLALKGKTKGYISIGIQPGSMMKNSDIILGFIKEGKVELFDQYSTGDFGPHPSDKDLGGTNDILEYGGKEEDDYTIIEFKRLLKTEDKYDLELKPGKNKIIWAYSDQDNLQARHGTRGYGEIIISENK